jgi:hypothetical protein
MPVGGVDDQHIDTRFGEQFGALLGAGADADGSADAQAASASLLASGCSVVLMMSLTVIRPRNSKASLTTSTRSSRCLWISALPSSTVAPSRTVTRRSRGVMMLRTGWSSLVSKRRSRLVTMPTTSWPSSTGTPEILCRWVSASTSRTDMFGGTVIGSFRMPDSKRLTLATSAACALGLRFLCTIPIPPPAPGRSPGGFGDGVHGRRNQWQIEADVAGQARLERDVARHDRRVGGNEEDVVERQRPLD